jgi:hypothetical protein
MAGALSSSAQGAAAGSSFGPYGALIGGIAGGIGGAAQALLGNSANNDKLSALIDSLSGQKAQASGHYSNADELLNALYGQSGGQYTNQNLNAAKSQIDNASANLSGGVSKQDIADQLNPQVEYQTNQATQALQGAYGNKGSLFSGAAGNKVAQTSNMIANNAWNDAAQRAMANLQNKQAQSQANIGNYSNLFGTDAAGVSNKIQNKEAALQADTDFQSLLAQAQSGKKGTAESLLEALFG